jgi:hypothetical protein
MAYDALLQKYWGPAMRSVGKRLYHAGIQVQGHYTSDERFV